MEGSVQLGRQLRKPVFFLPVRPDSGNEGMARVQCSRCSGPKRNTQLHTRVVSAHTRIQAHTHTHRCTCTHILGWEVRRWKEDGELRSPSESPSSKAMPIRSQPGLRPEPEPLGHSFINPPLPWHTGLRPLWDFAGSNLEREAPWRQKHKPTLCSPQPEETWPLVPPLSRTQDRRWPTLPF